MNIKHRIELITVLLPSLHKPLIAAEIGVAEGNFSRDMLQAGVTMLYMVDVWERIKNQKGDASHGQSWHDFNWNRAQRLTLPWGYNRKMMKGLSVEMAKRLPDESLSLVYLDADHSYEGVINDLQAWYPKVVKGGVIAGHDYLNEAYGVKKAVHDFCRQYQYGVFLIPENKDEDAGFYFIKE
jgi:cephalosporin hydroxylase